MKIKQLSIFMENKVGIINEVISILSSNAINLRAFSVADGVEFGIMRLIVSEDVERAQSVLSEAGFKVNSTDVICVNTPNTAGALSVVMERLAQEGVFIQYMYAYSDGDMGSTIIRPTDMDRCVEILNSCREELSSKNPLYKF